MFIDVKHIQIQAKQSLDYLKQIYLQIIFVNNKQYLKMNFQGSIELIYGPMFSGKSSELLRKIRRFEHAKKKCLVVNYQHDNRYTQADEMATHDKVTKKALKTLSLMTILSEAEKYDVIGIDEGQFFKQIVQFCQIMANKNKIVVVAALDGTFQRKPFGNILNLIPLAEKVSKLCAVCVYCTNEAAFTKRIVNSKEIQLIGGDDMYKPVCRKCFLTDNQEENSRKVPEMQMSQEGNPEQQQLKAGSVSQNA